MNVCCCYMYADVNQNNEKWRIWQNDEMTKWQKFCDDMFLIEIIAIFDWNSINGIDRISMESIPSQYTRYSTFAALLFNFDSKKCVFSIHLFGFWEKKFKHPYFDVRWRNRWVAIKFGIVKSVMAILPEWREYFELHPANMRRNSRPHSIYKWNVILSEYIWLRFPSW